MVAALLCPQMVEKERIFLSLLKRPPILSDQGPSLTSSFKVNYLLKTVSPNTITLQVETLTQEFEEQHDSGHSS